MKKTTILVVLILLAVFTQTASAQKPTTTNVQNLFNTMATGSESQRKEAKETLVNLCKSDKVEVIYLGGTTKITDGNSHIKDYCDSVILLNKKTSVLKLEYQGDKITEIVIKL